ncbi:MAG: class I SAM-dependent methyltransferase [Bdellovibrionota bacterium]
MKSIPKANTQKNVNQVVYESLVSKLEFGSADKLLVDAPCGNGEFAKFLRDKYPNLEIKAVDLFTEVADTNIQFYKLSAHDFFALQKPASADFITCISGVMCFDGIPNLITLFFKALRPSGTLVLTNDNIMTMRDRLHFLFFGHFKRFKLLYSINEGNWNIVLPQAIVSLLQENGFKNIRIKYTSVYAEDLLFLPLAILVYPIFALYLLLRKSHLSIGERFELFPFQSLISRHYVITSEKIHLTN